MSFSDYDSDGYSSAQDEDYLPSDENLSEDDINECEREEPLHEDEQVPPPGDAKKKKRSKEDRNREKRGQKLKKTEEGEEGEEVQQHNDEDDETRKKKSDDLWASFLSDVGAPPKSSQSAPTAQAASSSEVKVSSGPSGPPGPSGPATVTITKVFDFAGEEVRVNKEVLADSREAKSFLKSQSAEQPQDGKEEETLSPQQPTLPGPSVKRPAGMFSILSRIGGKKQKMSTLEKSKMDWDAFKCEEGITDELAIHNRGKEGYVERKNFLERVDHRQFEREKAVRLSNMKQ